MFLLLYPMLLPMVVCEMQWSEPYNVFAHDLWKQPTGSEKLAVALPIREVWIKATEGEKFVGTNDFCLSTGFNKGAIGWTWQPTDIDTVVPYNDQTWYSVEGYCRLLSPPANVNSRFYLYAHGQKWSFALEYLNNESEHTCPANLTEFLGVEPVNRRNKFTYNVPATPGTAQFCILSMEAPPGCLALPLEFNGKRFAVWNATIESKTPLFFSAMEGGCAATLPLYEFDHGENFEYSTKHEESPWKLLGWVWPSHNCQT